MAGKVIGRVLLALLLILLLLAVFGTAAHAAGLVDDTVDAANEYSKYPLDNYQLDFYVNSRWDWLPWNWLDGIGKQVMYGLYAITNFIWTISLYLSNATGYLIQEPTHWTSFPLRRIPLGKYADLGRRYHQRLVLGGILYRVPADSHSGGRDLCLPIQDSSNGKPQKPSMPLSISWWCSCCPLPLSPMPLIISGKSIIFRRHQQCQPDPWYKDCAAKLGKSRKRQCGFDTEQPVFHSG